MWGITDTSRIKNPPWKLQFCLQVAFFIDDWEIELRWPSAKKVPDSRQKEANNSIFQFEETLGCCQPVCHPAEFKSLGSGSRVSIKSTGTAQRYEYIGYLILWSITSWKVTSERLRRSGKLRSSNTAPAATAPGSDRLLRTTQRKEATHIHLHECTQEVTLDMKDFRASA